MRGAFRERKAKWEFFTWNSVFFFYNVTLPHYSINISKTIKITIKICWVDFLCKPVKELGFIKTQFHVSKCKTVMLIASPVILEKSKVSVVGVFSGKWILSCIWKAGCSVTEKEHFSSDYGIGKSRNVSRMSLKKQLNGLAWLDSFRLSVEVQDGRLDCKFF